MKAALIALALLTTPASATIYLLNVSPIVSGFIETDGTLGELHTENILDWHVVNVAAGDFAPDNSTVRVIINSPFLNGPSPPGVFATPDGLFIPWGADLGFIDFTSTARVPDGPFAEFCFCTAQQLRQHAFQYTQQFIAYFSNPYSILDPQIATAVPEPPTWALLLFGFAFFGIKGIWPGKSHE